VDDTLDHPDGWTRRSTANLPAGARSDVARQPGDKIGKFLLEVRLGGGAQGEVWQALDTVGPLGHVALKIPEKHMAAKWAEQWLQDEVGSLRKLAQDPHPNIVPILDAGVVQDVPYVAFRLVERGLPLDHYVVQQKLPVRQKALLVAELAQGVGHAHQCGVVHRDIKPANIIVGRDGLPMLADFGLARWVDAYQTKLPPELAGTPSFIAPEQARSEPGVDHRVDVFSLGATLRFLLTGEGPYYGSRDEQLAQAKAGKGRLINPLEVPLPPRLAEICNRAMAPRLEDRYSSAGELAHDLFRWANRSRRITRPLGVAVAVAVLVGTGLLFLRGSGPEGQDPGPAKPSVGPLDAADTSTPLEIKFQRSGETGRHHTLDEDHLPLRTGDRVQFHVRLPRPMFVYLLALQPSGKPVQLFPKSGQPSRQQELRIPAIRNGWLELADPSGVTTVALLASDEQRDHTGLLDELAALGPPPQLDPQSFCVLRNARTEIRRPPQRDIVTTRVVISDEGLLEKVQHHFAERFELIYAVAFPQASSGTAPPSQRGRQ